MAKYQYHIVSNPETLLGKLVIKGTRISVEFVLKKLSESATIAKLAEQHGLDIEAIYAALDYAFARLSDKEELVS
ncbi:MAG: DUF433 domain-containing protein [Flavobacteriaceae bacterium]|nr:MAG: DUF433 domain-containing protein [Flavobacteriaceae bacterium]